MATEPASELLERESELAEVEGAIANANRRGALLLVEGPAGIGKTSLLAAARERAETEGLRVLSARGAELERGFPFGIVRQLLEQPLRAASEERRSAWLAGAARLAGELLGDAPAAEPAVGDAGYARVHGLYWLCVNLADEVPLVLVIDDAHWADVPSLEFLGFLGRRLEELRVVVLVAARSREPGASPLLEALATDATTSVLHPPPLSVGAVGAWVRSRVRDDADGRFCAACHATTGGNPLLVGQLLLELEAAKIPPTAAEAERVAALAPSGVARMVLVRLARLGEPGSRLARALAILGESPGVALAAELADLDPETATAIAGALVRAGVLTDEARLSFVHPIVRAAVLDDIPVPERQRAHARAARLLAARDAPARVRAPHLIATEPNADPATAAVVAAAAGEALGLGDARTAVAYLRRALAEPPAEDQRPGMLAALGRAETYIGEPDAIAHLREAVRLARSARESALYALELARALRFSGRAKEALDAVDAGQVRLGGAEPRLAEKLEMERLASAFLSREAHRVTASRLAKLTDPGPQPSGPLESFTLVALAADGAHAGRPADEVAGLAGRALRTGQLRDPASLGLAAGTLVWAERLPEAERLMERALERARAQGSRAVTLSWLSMRSLVRYRRGNVPGAESDASTVLELAPELRSWQFPLMPLALAALLHAALDRGAGRDELTRLAEAIARHGDPDSLLYAHPLHARARLLADQGQHRAALEQFLALGRDELGATPDLPWRSSAALAHRALGAYDEAGRLAFEELEIARHYGAPRLIGTALRAAGMVTEGDQGVGLLCEAVDVLERSTAALEHARAQIELGAAMRRRGDRVASREPLRHGLETATRCGATALAERALEELLAAGARPRRTALAGAAALTPAERRVAELAGQGLSNRAIAQALFVTEKTVETHLSRSYTKLRIRGRRELAPAMAGDLGDGPEMSPNN